MSLTEGQDLKLCHPSTLGNLRHLLVDDELVFLPLRSKEVHQPLRLALANDFEVQGHQGAPGPLILRLCPLEMGENMGKP